jgi:murein DD-endopeptidase MepM/ murein hydrolase activator NlpD
VAAALIAPSLSIAAGGGATAPAGSGGGGTTAPAAGTQAPPPAAGGGTTAPEPGTQSREERRRPPRKRRKRPTPPPSLTSFHAGASRFYDLGSPARIAFRIDGRSTTVRVKLLVLRAGKRIRTIDLGDRSTGRRHSIALTGREGGGRFPEGALQLRLTARDPRGRGLRASSRASATGSLAFYWHRFPLLGDFSYGGDGSRFGAGRPGHVHQGQDLSAAPGTPVVAPRGGVVRTVAYQAGGAGHYVVLEASGENRTYVFMHLLDGSVRVREGERVATGQRLADVGSTGSSSGPHLHFEIWAGAWQAGGRPLDPLPYLRRWDGWS